MAELPHTFTVREIGEIRHEGEDTFNGVVLEGSKEAIRSIAPLFGEKVILAALSTQEARMVKVKQLEWRADHGVAGHGPYRLFEAFTPIGRFSYGTDSEGSPWWCAQYGGIFTVGDEDTAKRLAEAAWSKAALDEAAKFVDLSPAPDMREAVEALLAVVAAIRAYLPPDGITAAECIDRVLAATDNAKINPIIHRAENGHGHS